MNNKTHHNDFLKDDLFLYWRLNPSKELNCFWGQFIQKNEHLKEPFNKAIEEFENIRNSENWPENSDIEVKRVLERRIKKSKYRKKTLKILYASLSAAIFTAGIILSFFYLDKSNENMPSPMSSIGNVTNESKIILLTGNDMLDIEENSTLNLSEKGTSAVIKDSITQKEIALNKNQVNKLIVPFGKRGHIVLSDGSKVHLNSGTEMTFPSAFTSQSREIWVKGEIFIDVTKQSGVPFIIHTPHSQITVLGTSFNVSSYSEEVRESVVLVDGLLSIKSGDNSLLLNPNEMAVIEGDEMHRKEVDVNDFISWTNGYLQLKKTPLPDVLKKIGRYYNIEFRFQDDLNLEKMSCSGKLFLSNDIQDVLTAFSQMTFLSYDKQGETVYIKK